MSIALQSTSSGAAVIQHSANTSPTVTLPSVNGELSQHQGLLSIPAPTLAGGAMTLNYPATVLRFRSATLGDGTATPVSIAAQTLTIPSGATLGTINAVQSSLILLYVLDAGVAYPAVVNLAGGNALDESGLISTSAISAAANSANVIYSVAAHTNCPYKVVARVDSTQATAGTWATAPSLVQGVGGQALAAMGSLGFGQTLQDLSGSRALGTTYYNTTGKPILVSVTSVNSSSANVSLNINGIPEFTTGGAAGLSAGVIGIVPQGASYQVSWSAGSPTLQQWNEIR